MVGQFEAFVHERVLSQQLVMQQKIPKKFHKLLI